LKSLGRNNVGGKVSDSIGEQLELSNMGWIKIRTKQHGMDQNLILFIPNFDIIGQESSAMFIPLIL
jgi:hypothetical protein